MPKPLQSGKHAARALVSGLLLATMLLLLAPSSSYLAIEQPHVGFGAFLAERSDAYLVDNMEFDWVVWQLQWSLAEPSKGHYEWLGLDQLLANAQSEGLKVVLRVDSAPGWARSGPVGAPPNDMGDFGDFMSAVATRAAGEVAGYVIWNEPNLPINWGGSPSAAQYVQMLKAVYPRIKAADPDAAVVTAGMATTGGPGGGQCGLGSGLASGPLTAYTQELYAAGVVNDLDFICRIYLRGGKPYFDVLSSHPYGFAYDPQRDPGSVSGLAFRRVEQQRALMEIWNDGNTQIWAIEFGWILDPGSTCRQWGDWPTRTWQIVTEERQAEYLRDAYLYAWSRYPWMGVMSFFNMDFATVYWYHYCEPVRWYSVAYRQNHLDPGHSPIWYRESYHTLRGMARALAGGPKAFVPLGLRNRD
ncbi:MAG TPA: beta-galactosidase [Anaerolineae bacterium]|nr:beta-galactosidase [Anaerolineae bacterium]